MSKKIHAIAAKNFAQSILEEYGLLTLPVDIFSLAEKKNIDIQEMPQKLASNTVYGALLVQNNFVKIYYSTTINNIGFKNFTIAHELGHYFLEGHIEQVIGESGVHISVSDFCSKDNYEFEADQFAAGLLMPEKLCKRLVGNNADGIEGIKALAKETWSSLTAAAIRYIDLTSASSAVVISSKGSLEYVVPTREMVKVGIFPPRGTKIPASTLTAKFFNMRDDIPTLPDEEGELESDLSLWVGGQKSIPCTEQVVKLGRTGKILTVLTCCEFDDEENEQDSDDEFQSRWGLKFR